MDIIINKPYYSSQAYSYLFISRLHYSYKQRKGKNLKNVFISNNGTLIKNGLLVKGSIENLVGKYDQNFYLQHWKKGIEQFVVAKYGKSLRSIHLKNENYFSIHTPWFGYFSWLTSYLPRLIKRLESSENSKLIIPKEWNDINFVKDILDTFKSLNYIHIPEDHHVFVENYYLEPIRPWTSHFIKSDLDLVRKHFDFLIKKDIKPFRRVYISRNQAKRRRVVNEHLFIDFLLCNNFEIIEFENLTVLQQVKLMNETEIFIGLHGAGLTNLMFMNPKSQVVELTPIISDFKKFRFPFWRMADLLGINYSAIFCRINEFKEIDDYSNDIIVDIEEFKSLIEKLV